MRSSAEPLASRPRSREAGANALRDPCAFKFRDCRQDVHLELASGRRRVDALRERHERDAQGLQVLE